MTEVEPRDNDPTQHSNYIKYKQHKQLNKRMFRYRQIECIIPRALTVEDGVVLNRSAGMDEG